MIYLSNYSINLNPHVYALEPTYHAYANGGLTLYSSNKPLSGFNSELKPHLNFQSNQSQHNVAFALSPSPLLPLLPRRGEGKGRGRSLPSLSLKERGARVNQNLVLKRSSQKTRQAKGFNRLKRLFTTLLIQDFKIKRMKKPMVKPKRTYALFKQRQGRWVKSKPLLCWHADIGFLNLRHWFLNLLRAMHLLWTTAKNNGRVMLINHGGPLDVQAHLSAVDNLMLCQLSPTLRRQALPHSPKQANQPVSLQVNFNVNSPFQTPSASAKRARANAKTLPLANPSVGFPKLTQLTQFNTYTGLGVGKINVDSHEQLRARLWIKFHQLSSRLVTCTYGAVKMGWFSNSFASNDVWNPLMLYDRYNPRFDALLKQPTQQLSKGSFKPKSHEQNRVVLPMGMKAKAQGHGLTTLPYKSPRPLASPLPPFGVGEGRLRAKAKNTHHTLSFTRWFQLSKARWSKPYLQDKRERLPLLKQKQGPNSFCKAEQELKKSPFFGFANPNSRDFAWSQDPTNLFRSKPTDKFALAVLDFCSSITNSMAAKNYMINFYKNKSTVEPKQTPHQRSNMAFLSPKRRTLYDALSTGRKSTYDQLLAKNILLGQINAVVFSHPENSAKLVQQARNLNIPTIGLCGGFAQKNLKAKPNQYRQWVDFPVIANPNKNNVTMLFCNITKASLKQLKA